MACDNEGFRLHRWDGALHFERWSIPEPPPGEVQVEVEACGIGLTVLNNTRGVNWRSPELLPRVPGHEIVGRVVAVGDEVTSLAVGARVLAYFYLSCFSCSECQAGREERCPRGSGRLGIHRDGGYARLVNLPAGNAIPFESELDAAQAVVIPDAVATPVHVCRTRLGVQPGDRVAVVGAGGGVGAHLVQVARACGAVVVGLDRTPPKLHLIESLGVIAVDSGRFDAVDLEAWGGVADAIVDFVGSPESLSWGLDHLAHGGQLCVLTTFRDVTLPLAPRDLVARELTVLGSHYASRREVGEAASLVSSGQVTPVVGSEVVPDTLGDVHQALAAGTLIGRGALRWDVRFP